MPPSHAQRSNVPAHYWAEAAPELLRQLATGERGLTSDAAQRKLQEHGRNELVEHSDTSRLVVLWNQLRNPLLLLLLFAAVISAGSGEWTDAAIVSTIVCVTVGIGYRREYDASRAVSLLAAQIRTQARVLRDGVEQRLPVEELVPGDVILLAAGSIVPADCVVLDATDCHVSEAALTGESFPVEKSPGLSEVSTSVSQRTNCVFMGTNVRSGTARCVVVATGTATEFGAIAHRLTLANPETEFDRGVRRFGYLLMSTMLVMVLVVFAAHMLQGRPPIETLLFAIALAVGLSPELLPAILSVNLSRGARMMASHGVLVRRLNAIENLGSMDILCTDKTGTLTEGVVNLDGAFDVRGAPDATPLELGAINAALETGLPSPLDDALLRARTPDVGRLRKLAEIPFDFTRKRVGVVVRHANGRTQLIVKGAFDHVTEVCTRLPDGSSLTEEKRAELTALYTEWSSRGVRVLGVAERDLPDTTSYGREVENELTFVGFLTFLDRPKPGVRRAIEDLAGLGVGVKLITGDSKYVAIHVANLVGLSSNAVLTGAELERLPDEALWRVGEHTDLFVEVDPNQKERVLLALKKTGHVVGFLGDGVNDAPAMHAADTSISVDQAVDVARAAADFVLLEHDLNVIRRGIEEGRKTFANTLKYVVTTTSANLGNMLSMAVASLFLPFLPLLASQILLNNFISDIPAVGVADDNVDADWVTRPHRWDLRFIARFMRVFGLLSSAFDLLTFATLLFLFEADAELFRTGWFVESLLTELLVALVVRTRGPFLQSRPGRVLLISTLVLLPLTVSIPYLPYAGVLGFRPLPPTLLAALLGITALYVVATELTKRRFYGSRYGVGVGAPPALG